MLNCTLVANTVDLNVSLMSVTYLNDVVFLVIFLLWLQGVDQDMMIHEEGRGPRCLPVLGLFFIPLYMMNQKLIKENLIYTLTLHPYDDLKEECV